MNTTCWMFSKPLSRSGRGECGASDPEPFLPVAPVAEVTPPSGSAPEVVHAAATSADTSARAARRVARRCRLGRLMRRATLSATLRSGPRGACGRMGGPRTRGATMERHVTPSGNSLVTVIPGDGIGPEVVRSAQRIVEAAGARVAWEEREAGAEVFRRGLPSGVPPETIESIRKTHVVLKGPLYTPLGFR